jgi:hypothetical protein
VTASDLRAAIEAHEASQQALANTEAKLAELRARHLEAVDAFGTTRAQRADALAMVELGEAEQGAVVAADRAHAEAEQKATAIENAIDILTARVVARGVDVDVAENRLHHVMASCAAPLAAEVLANVQAAAEQLAQSLRLFYRLECATRGTVNGFLSGNAAQNAAGNPARILEAAGIRCAEHALYPQLLERLDYLKPAQLLALIERQ